MEFLKICIASIAAAIAYGILHDQVTAHLCVEYFSIAHPTILPSTSPTLLALQWGILATWWVGACLGILLAISARAGSKPKLTLTQLYRPLGLLLVCMGIGSLLAGITGFALAKLGRISIDGWLAAMIPPEKHARFMADWWAHSAAYLVGMFGGLLFCIRNSIVRVKLSNKNS